MSNNPYYLAPSELTAGKGFDFEDLVSSWLCTFILSGLPLFNDNDAVVNRIDFQVGNKGWLLDDILLTLTENGKPIKCAISIKSDRQFTAKKAPTDFVEAIWRHYLQDDGNTLFDRDNDYLGIITAPLANTAQTALSTLTSKAKHSIGDDLSKKIANGQFSKDATSLYNSFNCPIDLANKYQVGPADLDNLLKRLKLLSSDMNQQVSSNFSHAISNCQSVLTDPKPSNATALFDKIHSIVKPTRVNEGSLDSVTLLSKLRSQYAFKAHPEYVNDIKLMGQYANSALEHLPHLIGGSLAVNRIVLVSELKTGMEQADMLILLGESGAGKSVLAKQLAQNDFAGKTIWLDSNILESKTLRVAVNDKQGIEHQWTDVIESLPLDNYLVVIDGLDRLNDSDFFATTAQLLKPFLIHKVSCKVVLTCQQTHWGRVQQSLFQHISEITTAKLFTVAPFNQDEIDQITQEFPQFIKVFDSDRLQPFLQRPKVIDLFTRYAQLPDTSKWTSEANLIQWFWQVEIAHKNNGGMRASFSLALATKLGDSLLSSAGLGAFSTADLAILEDLKNDDVCQLNNSSRLSFTHDLFADWFRQRVILQNEEEDQDYIFTKLDLPSWHRAIVLFGLHLLESDDSPALWHELIKSALANKERLFAADLLLESVIHSANPRALMETLWPTLIDDKAKLLKKLLNRFLFAGTQPDPLFMALARHAGADTVAASTWRRQPLYSYWPGILAIIASKSAELIKIAPTEIAQICLAWLYHAPQDAIYRKELASIAIEIAWKVLQHRQHSRSHDSNRWLDYSDDEKAPFFYEVAFNSLSEQMDEVVKLAFVPAA